MVKIGLISDTHSFLDEKVFDIFANCDEIWHAGDFGSLKVLESLASFKPLKGVYGNIDGQEIREIVPLKSIFMIENVKVYMTHIAGYPGNYSAKVKKDLLLEQPTVCITGHSHILKVMYDEKLQHLHINPGAAGREGFHLMRTVITFEINENRLQNLLVHELGKRGVIQ